MNGNVRLVLIGGGHTHALVLKTWAERGLVRAGVPFSDVVLVSDHARTAYSGMYTGRIAGLYATDDIYIDMRGLARRAGARFIESRVTGLDLEQSLVRLENGESLAFDLASIDCGAKPNRFEIPGAQNAVRLKPVEDFYRELEALEKLEKKGSYAKVVLVGGGAAGTEVACAIAQRWRGNKFLGQLTLVEPNDRILTNFPESFSNQFTEILREHGIRLLLNTQVNLIEGRGPYRLNILSEGREIELEADLVAFATPVVPDEWIRGLGLSLGGPDDAFLAVNEYLQTSDPRVFAAGDVAWQVTSPSARAGVFAVRQAPILAENLQQAADHAPLFEYRPQEEALALMIDGWGRALGARGSLLVPRSKLSWWFKDWLDRSFVESFKNV